MSHFISNKKPGHIEYIDIDVSFIYNYLYTINGTAIEHLVIKNYSSVTDAKHNTIRDASVEMFHKMGYVDDEDTNHLATMKSINKGNVFISTVMKIVDALDAIVVRESDCEMFRASFNTFVEVTREKMVVKFKIEY